MYVKYKLAAGFTWQQFMTDLKNLILGNATTLAELVAVDVIQSEIAGTGPTAGTYSFVSENYPNTGNGNFKIKKKHAQWATTTFEAEMTLTIGCATLDVTYRHFWLAASDINDANYLSTLLNWGRMAGTYQNQSTYNSIHNIGNTGSQEIHMIINDSTLAIVAKGADNADIPNQSHVFMHWTDFRKTAYDDLLMAGNSAYYPGAYIYHHVPGAWQNNYATYDRDYHNYAVFRHQYAMTKGGYANTVSSSNPSAVNGTRNYWNYTVNDIGNNVVASPTTLPRPYMRIFQILRPDTGLTVPPRIPLIYDALGMNGIASGVIQTSSAQDVNMHAEFLDVYRTADDLGWNGDIVIDNSANYRVFRGTRTGGQNSTIRNTSAYLNGYEFTGYNSSCYLFPEDNVVV